jgi:GNAT superfamily N-acetyltransferase
MIGPVQLRPLTSEMATAFASMTFPAYRHLLAMTPAPRHLDGTNQQSVQPVGIAALSEEQAVGLVLAEIPVDRDGHPQMLSLFVRHDRRGQGIGTRLVGALEESLQHSGHLVVDTVYMTGRPTTAAVERILEKCGWGNPVTRALSVRFTPQEASRTPWFKRVALPSADYEIFSWTELQPQERGLLKSSHETAPWIARGLEPWQHDYYGFDPISSLGLRYRGAVIGWVINHRLSADCVRFTCSFIRADLRRRGRILPLYTESIQRVSQAGIRECSLVTPLEYSQMVAFLKRRCASAVHFFAETRASAKLLQRPRPCQAGDM